MTILSFFFLEEMNDEEDYLLPPELEQLLRGASPPPVQIPPLSDSLSFAFPFNREHGNRKADTVDTILANHGFEQLLPKVKEPEEVQGSVDVAMSVKCDDKSMTVAVAKDSLEVGVDHFMVWQNNLNTDPHFEKHSSKGVGDIVAVCFTIKWKTATEHFFSFNTMHCFS